MMKKSMKSILCVVFVAVLILGAVGCGASPAAKGTDVEKTAQGSEESGDSVTISWGVYETDNLTAEYWDKIIEAFEADNPNIKVEKMVATGDDRTAYWKTLYASGGFPDIVLEAHNLAGTEGIFTEVPEDVLELFDPNLLVTYNGKYTLIPANTQYRTQCYYNKADFEELGLSEPTTWNDFIALCDKLKSAGKVPLMCGGTGDVWATGEPWWASATNQTILHDYPNFMEDLANGSVKWNNETITDSFGIWQDMVDKGYYYEGSMSLSYSQALAEFLNGKASMMIDGSWEAATLDATGNQDYGVFVVPNPDGKDDSYCVNIGYWGVSEKCENKDAAFTFVKYVLGGNPDIYRHYLEADGLFSSTVKPVTYELGDVMGKFVENLEGKTRLPEITLAAGEYGMPSGWYAYVCKSMQNIYNGADISAELSTWDEEFATLKDAS